MANTLDDIRYFLQEDIIFLLFFFYFSYASTLLTKKRLCLPDVYNVWGQIIGILFAYSCLGFTILYMQFIGVDSNFIMFFLIYHLNFLGIADYRYYSIRM